MNANVTSSEVKYLELHMWSPNLASCLYYKNQGLRNNVIVNLIVFFFEF